MHHAEKLIVFQCLYSPSLHCLITSRPSLCLALISSLLLLQESRGRHKRTEGSGEPGNIQRKTKD